MTGVSRETVSRKTGVALSSVAPENQPHLTVVSRETVPRKTADDGQWKECGRPDCACLIPKKGQRYCRDCATEYMREWRESNKTTPADRRLLRLLLDTVDPLVIDMEILKWRRAKANGR